MAVDPISIAGSAGTQLLSGVMDSIAKAEERKKQMLMEAQNQQFQAANESAKSLGTGQQRAFESLMAGYRDALGRR